jgi:hypothetical protein
MVNQENSFSTSTTTLQTKSKQKFAFSILSIWFTHVNEKNKLLWIFTPSWQTKAKQKCVMTWNATHDPKFKKTTHNPPYSK